MLLNLSGLPFNSHTMALLGDKLQENGFCLDDFEIEKSIHPRSLRGIGREYDYTVSIQGKKFTITFANDEYFANFLYDLCCSEKHDNHSHVSERLNKIVTKIEQGIEITKHWLIEDPFKK